MTSHDAEIVVIGAGIAGIAAAYYLATQHKRTRLAIIDEASPMALTSAQSGENYRNWWPHSVMTDFVDHSIDLMEEIARRTNNRFQMTRRGYLLATRDAQPDARIAQLYSIYGAKAEGSIRIHDDAGKQSYQPPISADWQTAPSGVDVLRDRALIREHFPYLDPEIATILHIRRAGDISGQQLGQQMLEEMQALGVRLHRGRVASIAKGGRFSIETLHEGATTTFNADIIVNAAGPFAADIARMHGETLPLFNVLQQKVTLPDREGAVSRKMPFAIDMDGQTIAWTEAEREALASDPSLANLLKPMTGNIHCRPDGGENGQWIKIGWAYNTARSEPSREPRLDDNFPEIVLRGVGRMLPALRCYLNAPPRDRVHYGGYYPMTAENYPLIGAMKTPGAFMVGALSGFGTMGACAAGDLLARSVAGSSAPPFARALSIERYDDPRLMATLKATEDRSLL